MREEEADFEDRQRKKDSRRKFIKYFGLSALGLGLATSVKGFKLAPGELKTLSDEEIISEDNGTIHGNLDELEVNDDLDIGGELVSEEASFESLSSEFIDADEIDADQLDANNVNVSEKIDADEINVEQIDAVSATTENLETGEVEADEANIEDIDAETLDVSQLNELDIEGADNGNSVVISESNNLEAENVRRQSDRGLSLETRTDDPDDGQVGRIWLRTDLD